MHRPSNSLNGEGQPDLLALRFGPFEIDVRSGELRRNGTTVRLQPQPFKVLITLAERPGEVVTRVEVQAAVWPAGTFVDFEQSFGGKKTPMAGHVTQAGDPVELMAARLDLLVEGLDAMVLKEDVDLVLRSRAGRSRKVRAWAEST